MPSPAAALSRLVAHALIGAALACSASLAGARSDVLLLDQALSVESNAQAYPQQAAASVVRLPDEASVVRAPSMATVWYRLRFDAAPRTDQGATLALFIERACTRLDVHLNGERLHAESGSGPPDVRQCYRSRLINLPTRLLRAEGNELDLRLVGEPLRRVAGRQRAAGLSVVRVGPLVEMAALRDSHDFWHQTLPLLIGCATLLLGLFTLVLGWLHAHKRYLLHFGLLSLGWALLSSSVWFAAPWLSGSALEWTVCAAVPLVAAAAMLFLMRYAGLRVRAMDAALLAQSAIMPASLALAASHRLLEVANAWYLVLAVEVLLVALAMLAVAWRVQRREFWILLGPLALIALAIANELAQQRQWIDAAGPPALRLVMPLALIALGVRMLYREIGALRVADLEARAQFDRRVADAAAEAERTHATLAELRIEQVIQRERKRIAADLHDDLGAKLLTIVHTSESDRISTLAREALEEMRLSVRGLTGKPVRLSDALGDWRAEVVSRLGQANIGAEWQGPTEETPQTLPARSYVQTTRILREAVSNIIKHSGAARCKVHGRIQDGDFVLTIQDNGGGIPMELDGKLDRGHGMASMKQRAKQLHGQCLVESGPGFGTVIRLTIPL